MKSYMTGRMTIYMATVFAVIVCLVFFEPEQSVAGAITDKVPLQTIEESISNNKVLDAKQIQIRTRLEQKDQLLNELVFGNITILDVASAFLILNQEDETTLQMIRCSYPGNSDLEKAAYNVLDFLRSREMDECELTLILDSAKAEIEKAFPLSN